MKTLIADFYSKVPPRCETCGCAYTISPAMVGDEFVVKPRCQTGCEGNERYELRVKKEDL